MTAINVILHPDEIFLKGNNQSFFYACLLKNLRALFNGVKARRVESGIWLENFAENEMSRLALVPGIANFAPATTCASEIDIIKKTIINLLPEQPTKKKTTFRISAERSFKNFPITSMELEKQLGDLVRKNTNWTVNLENPAKEINISVGREQTIIFTDKIVGAGGLPTGCSGRVLCLLSGGIDSPVAAYQLMRRGAEVALVHFHNETTVSAEAGQKIFDLAKTLSAYQPDISLYVVPFATLQREIIKNIPSQYRMIVTRRAFNRLAEKIARENNCLALANGDSLGQVASQTLENMSVISSAAEILILSPLVGANKSEITKIAKTIGTFNDSIRPYPDCCSMFVARHPETRCAPETILNMEKNIDWRALDKIKAISYHISMQICRMK